MGSDQINAIEFAATVLDLGHHGSVTSPPNEALLTQIEEFGRDYILTLRQFYLRHTYEWYQAKSFFTSLLEAWR